MPRSATVRTEDGSVAHLRFPDDGGEHELTSTNATLITAHDAVVFMNDKVPPLIREYGIDPHDTAWIEYLPRHRAIRFGLYSHDEHGRYVVAPGNIPAIHTVDHPAHRLPAWWKPTKHPKD